jgi:hypothetical protein
VGKKVYFTGRARVVEDRSAIEITGGVVFVSQTAQWDDKTVGATMTVVGTLAKEEGDKPSYLLQEYKARGWGGASRTR